MHVQNKFQEEASIRLAFEGSFSHSKVQRAVVSAVYKQIKFSFRAIKVSDVTDWHSQSERLRICNSVALEAGPDQTMRIH